MGWTGPVTERQMQAWAVHLGWRKTSGDMYGGKTLTDRQQEIIDSLPEELRRQVRVGNPKSVETAMAKEAWRGRMGKPVASRPPVEEKKP